MKVIWTPRAASDLQLATDYIANDSPDSATHVASTIYKRIMELESTPLIGRVGLVPGTRELVFHPWPYIAVYKVKGEAVRIIRVRHASRQYP